MRSQQSGWSERGTRGVMGIMAGLLALILLCVSACGSAATDGEVDRKSPAPALSLVVIGDSIPYNSPEDCPGCRSFADRYAQSIEAAADRPVSVKNLSQHNNLTLPLLLQELDTFQSSLAPADVIVVGIAHNTIELNADRPCGQPLVDDQPDWTAMTRTCADNSTKAARPLYDELFTKVRDMREGKPTILRTINRYNDWIGWSDARLTPGQTETVVDFIAKWNEMLCASATEHGFGCADLSAAFNGPDGTKPSGDLLADDYTHPSDKGNTLIAERLTALGFAPLTP